MSKKMRIHPNSHLLLLLSYLDKKLPLVLPARPIYDGLNKQPNKTEGRNELHESYTSSIGSTQNMVAKSSKGSQH